MSVILNIFLLSIYFTVAAISSSENEETPDLLSRNKREWEQTKKGYTFEEKVAIIRKHNEFRSSIWAVNMRALTWDTELESTAQSYAELCVFEHSGTTGIGVWNNIGENLYAAKNLNATKPVEKWFDEYKYYDIDTLKCKAGKQCGHYTQVVWSETEKLGCGVSFCETLNNTAATNIWYAVCNYAPAGNWPQMHPYGYMFGYPCFLCPSDQPDCDPDLQLCVNLQCGRKTCMNGGELLLDVCECNCSATPYSGEFCNEGYVEDSRESIASLTDQDESEEVSDTDDQNGESIVDITETEFFDWGKDFLAWISHAMLKYEEDQENSTEVSGED